MKWILEQGQQVDFLWKEVDQGWMMIYNKLKDETVWDRSASDLGVFKQPQNRITTSTFTEIESTEELFLFLFCYGR